MFVSILLYQMEFTLPITVIKIICPGLVLRMTLIWRVRDDKMANAQGLKGWHLSSYF